MKIILRKEGHYQGTMIMQSNIYRAIWTVIYQIARKFYEYLSNQLT